MKQIIFWRDIQKVNIMNKLDTGIQGSVLDSPIDWDRVKKGCDQMER